MSGADVGTMMRWTRARGAIRRLAGAADLLPSDDELVSGERYVWVVSRAESRLAVGDLVEVGVWAESAHLPGEALAQAFRFAVLARPDGQLCTVPRADVLWRLEDDDAIRAATRSLGLELVPHSYRGRQSWRLGSVRLAVPDMVELGRLVALP